MTTDASRETELRTTAECLERLLPQVRLLAKDWPNHASDVEQFIALTSRVLASARAVGYVGRAS